MQWVQFLIGLLVFPETFLLFVLFLWAIQSLCVFTPCKRDYITMGIIFGLIFVIVLILSIVTANNLRMP